MSSPSDRPSQEWLDAASSERTWYGVQMLLLGVLLLAVATWPATRPNRGLEVLLCVAVAVVASRHAQASRRRARLAPLRAAAMPPTDT